MSQIRIVIPTYNAKRTIVPLVESFLFRKDQYPIVVCDDASTDGTIEALASRFGSKITVIRGKNNLGPGGNRNRCLAASKLDDILFFIDADAEIIYKHSLAKLTAGLSDPSVGAIGYGVVNKKGNPMEWNYGWFMHPVHDAYDYALERMWRDHHISANVFRSYAPHRAMSLRLTKELKLMPVDWVIELCFSVRARVFRNLKGYDCRMRYHEAHDFYKRMKNIGLSVHFMPIPVAKHLELDSRYWRRTADDKEGKYLFYYKHWGIKRRPFEYLHES